MDKLMELTEEIKEIQGVSIDILKDVLKDREKEGFRKTVTIWMLIIFLVSSLVGTNIYYQYTIDKMAEASEQRIFDFLREYEFETTYTQDANVDNGSYITDNFKINEK